MKTIFAILFCTGICIRAEHPPRIEINFESPAVDNEFTKLNPDYKERAGSFYERKYLPDSAEYLFEVCSIDPKLHPYVMEILRAFIYDWVDAYMRGNGRMSEDVRAPIVTKMEERLLALLDAGQRAQFPAWRYTKTGKNKLKFIMGDGPKKLPSEQAGAGEPATRPKPKPEGSDKSQPEPEGHSR